MRGTTCPIRHLLYGMFINTLGTKYCVLIHCYTLCLLTGFSKSEFPDCTTCDFERLLGVLFYCIERLDWVEECACSGFVAGVNGVIFCRSSLYIYV